MFHFCPFFSLSPTFGPTLAPTGVGKLPTTKPPTVVKPPNGGSPPPPSKPDGDWGSSPAPPKPDDDWGSSPPPPDDDDGWMVPPPQLEPIFGWGGKSSKSKAAKPNKSSKGSKAGSWMDYDSDAMYYYTGKAGKVSGKASGVYSNLLNQGEGYYTIAQLSNESISNIPKQYYTWSFSVLILTLIAV